VPIEPSAPAPVALRPHPVYTTLQPVWEKLAHAVEGTGGFLDGGYLIAHPREWLDHTAETPTKPTKKLKERRQLARYEHWPRTIISLLSGGLFRQPPVRRVGDPAAATPHPLAVWWEDVDGHGTDIDTFLRTAWDAAATFGHVFLLFDRPAQTAPTAADARAPYLRLYSPLDVPDWLTDDAGMLTAVRLLEGVPRETFDGQDGTQIRDVTVDGWSVVMRQADGRLDPATQTRGTHDYAGALPVVILYGNRPMLSPVVGQSVLGDPKVIQDHYNLVSEHRELLRKQTFAMLNVPLGTGPDAVQVDQAQAMLGQVSGTANVAFTPLAASFLSPDKANVDAYAEERERLERTMFRLAGLPWEADSRAAEAADSRRIKREDLNQTLATYADYVQAADLSIAELWYRAAYGAQWQTRWEADDVTIAYPDTFDSEVIDDTLARVQLAIALRLGKTAEATLRKKVVSKLLSDEPPTVLQAADAEIDAMPDPEEVRAEQRSAMVDAFRRQSPPASEAEPDEDDADEAADA